MRSPFPGMDPHLESRWGDVHSRLCTYLSEALQPTLPADLRARTERRVLLEDELTDLKAVYIPATTVFPPTRSTALRENGRSATTAGAAVTLEPVVIREMTSPMFHRWVQIIDVKSGNRVVTVIEILSPGNKRAGKLNEEYRAKLDEYVRAGVSVVEVDLLRGPRRYLRVQHEDLPSERAGEYLYLVRRAANTGDWFAYPMKLRDRLPVLPVPLRPTDDDVTLDLQPLIDRIYVAGGHDDIDYAKPADPPLSADDAAWAAELVAHRATT